MRSTKLFLGIIAVIIITVGCNRNSSTSWAFQFVVLNNITYQVTDEKIEQEAIEMKIGKVTKYSDKEGAYSNGFSNKYKKGTELFKIKGIDISKYIAVKDTDNTYIKLENKGKYDN